MGKSSSALPPPDPTAIANAQGDMNAEAMRQGARINRPQQFTPFGSSRWTNNEGFDQAGFDQAMADWQASAPPGGTPDPDRRPNRSSYILDNWANTQELDPRITDAFYTNLASERDRSDLAGFMGRGVRSQIMDQNGHYRGFDPQHIPAGIDRVDPGEVIDVVDLNGVPELPGQDDFGAERQRVEDALYSRQTSRLDPVYEKRRTDLETQLANQGFTRGSEAWNSAIGDFEREREMAYSGARNDSITMGGGEQSRLFGDALAARGQGVGERFQGAGFFNEAGAQDFNQRVSEGNFRNAIRGQRFGEELTKRNQAFNEYGQLIHGTGPQVPEFGPIGQVAGAQPPDFMGAAMGEYDGQLAAFGTKQSNRNANTGAAASIISSLAIAY